MRTRAPLASTAQSVIPDASAAPRVSEVARERLPTNTTAHRHAVHRWFNFIAGFAPEFVALHSPIESSVVLDPFAGCGTSLVVAQTLGHASIGFEPHPFFLRIARAKTAALPTESRLNAIEAALLNGIRSSWLTAPLTDAAEAFLVKLFELSTLRQLLSARASLEAVGLADDDLAFLLLSRVVDMCSKAQTDGIYKAPTTTKKALAPLDAVRTVITQIRHDVATMGGHNRALPSAALHQASSEDMSSVVDASVDVVITSPPYLNNFDFAEMTRMHLYFWGTCGSWREITECVRAKLLVNTTTALAGHREIQQIYREQIPATLHSELDHAVDRLAKERPIRAGKKEYDLLVYPYFAQMTNVLRESQRCLKAGGTLHVVVADAAFYGVHVSTPQLLAAAMSELGFQAVRCSKLRDRGHRWILEKRDGSPTGLGEYHVSAQREQAS